MSDAIFWMAALCAAAPLCFYLGFRNWRLARLIDDTPLARVRSAAQGYVELSGTANLPDGKPNVAPLSGLPCAWWLFRIEERRGSGRNQRWETIDHGVSTTPFRLADETGECLVDPAGADVRPGNEDCWRGTEPWPRSAPLTGRQLLGWGDYRYTEHRIVAGAHVSVIGDFRTLGGVSATDATGEVMNLLADWKKDQKALLQRFDANGDGVLSQEEWERARAAARAQVEQQALRAPTPTTNAVVRPRDGRPYLIAASDLGKLARHSRLAAGFLLAGFLVAVSALAVLFRGHGAP
jgi:hypothetical protein